jgi:hypothetical protein
LTAAPGARENTIVSDENKLKARLRGIESALDALEDEHKRGAIDPGRYMKMKVEYETSKAELEQELGLSPRGQGAVASAPEHLSISKIRQLLNRTFDDVGLDLFCLENFDQVYDRFSAGMRKDAKIVLLLDHCRRNELLDELVSMLWEIG